MATGRHRRATANRRRELEVEAAARTPRRRLAVAPWITASVVAALVFSGVTFGYVWISRAGCDGTPTELSVVVSPDQYDVMRSLARGWQDGEPSVDGRCASVVVNKQDSKTVADALTPTWDQNRTDVARPDVWVPDSSAWVLAAGNRPEAQPMLAGQWTSVASSPVVMAMPKPMAQELGWPNQQIGWFDFVTAHFKEQTWKDFGKPEWGEIRLGMTDPTRSTAGLLGLVPLSDSNGDDKVVLNEAKSLLVFSRSVTERGADSAVFLDQLRKAPDQLSAVRTITAFPTLEREVAAFNREDNTIDLVPVYPSEGTVFADYPYTVLRAPWVDSFRQRAAKEFLEYVRSEAGQKTYGQAGFRTPDRETRLAPDLFGQLGFSDQIGQVARKVSSAAAVIRTIVYWTALERTTTFLAVIDTSGSMAERIGDQTRMQIVQDAAIKAISLFADDSRVGLWQFSTNLIGNQDWREVVPLTRAGSTAPDGRPFRQVGVERVLALKPGGNTGLYDTVLAAYQHMQKNWQPRQLNLVVVLTDGRNQDANSISRATLLQRLRELSKPDRPVQIITLGLGDDVDETELRQISGVTGGRSFKADDANDLERLWLATILGEDPARE